MKQGNVLVIGNSGVGKSTLINAVLGEAATRKAQTGGGIAGTTKSIQVYDEGDVPFHVIDTIGFEPNFFKEQQAINAVKKWSKDCIKEGKENNQINVIWFCVDGTSKKLFSKSIQSLSRATAIWKNVPVIVVITKSYSTKEREENIQMVQNAFASQKKYAKNLKQIIPVVAAPYELDDIHFVAPDGIAELIDKTNELMPEGFQAGSLDIANFKLNRKRALAQGVIGVSATSAAVVGATPIPVPDAGILVPLEACEIRALSQIYGIQKDDNSKEFFNAIIEAGTVSMAAKTAINALKTVPIAGSVLNAIIAGTIVVALGEGSAYAFEQVYLGKKTVNDIDWVTKLLESKLTLELVGKVKKIIENLGPNVDANLVIKELIKIIK